MPTERQQGDEGKRRSERHTEFALVTFAAWTNEASGDHVYIPDSGYGLGSTSGMYGEEGRIRALRDLAQGGFVIDLRPLAEHPDLVRWVFESPMFNGNIEGNDIDRLSESTRRSAGQLAPWLGGEFQFMAAAAASGAFEPEDTKEAGAFDRVSAQYKAVWWTSRGALVGRRVGDVIQWSNGTEQAITPHEQPQTH